MSDRYVFDLDGTLIDTREAVRQAYRAAGLEEFPDDAWGKPAREWLRDEAVHTRKNALYPEMLRRYARKLPLLGLCLNIHAPVITGASPMAASHVSDFINDPRLAIMLWGASLGDKADWLRQYDLRRADQQNFYVDDNPNIRSTLEGMMRERWQMISPEEAFTRLSLPQARTHD